MGGVILPPVPAFYTRPKTLDDIVNHTVGRAWERLTPPPVGRRASGQVPPASPAKPDPAPGTARLGGAKVSVGLAITR